MERTRWWTYVERLMDAAGWNKADVARAAGVDQSVVGRWQNKGASPEASSVRGIAEAFGRDVREAAIAAELFTAEELNRESEPVIDPETFDLSVIPNTRLRDEVFARMERRTGRAPRTRVPGPSGGARTASGRPDVVRAPVSSGHESTSFGTQAQQAQAGSATDPTSDSTADAEDEVSSQS